MGVRAQGAGRGELRGRIVSVESGDPLPGATVIVQGTRLGGVADQRGVYSVRNIPVGAYTIRVSSLGYADQEITDVEIHPGVNLLDVILQDAAMEGEEVVVKGLEDPEPKPRCSPSGARPGR